jgi:DNA polymerase III delta prime subunit
MEKPFLYKYQPTVLNEYELKENIKSFLESLLGIDNLNILFVGESGSGKSSLISALINEYYGNQNKINNENILYINNLKEQGICYYRTELKTFCQTPCSVPRKKKLLVVDDIDFINEQSQQVFRNYLDKYSHNVHFIGSCINTQKVIDNLQSRLIIINIPNLIDAQLVNIIKSICSKEHIDISDDVIDFIISISNKSIRVIINYLEKFKLLNQAITVDIATSLCTNISFKEFNKYTELCKVECNLREAIKIMYNLINRGYSVMDILDNYFIYIKTSTIVTEEEKYEIIPYICKYISIFNNIHEDEIELYHFTNNLIHMFTPKV